jgi:phosphoglycerate dehydrogenase-like enzyme
MLDARRIGLMKRDALIVNTARSEIIDQPALVDALRSGRIGGAAVDVWPDDRPGNESDPLLDLENVVLTAHTAPLTPESAHNMEDGVIDGIRSVLAGRRPSAPYVKVMNPEVWDRRRSIHLA